MSKPAKIASNKKPVHKPIIKQCKIIKEGNSYIAIDYARGKKVSEGTTAEVCRRNATFRHGYEVVS